MCTTLPWTLYGWVTAAQSVYKVKINGNSFSWTIIIPIGMSNNGHIQDIAFFIKNDTMASSGCPNPSDLFKNTAVDALPESPICCWPAGQKEECIITIILHDFLPSLIRLVISSQSILSKRYISTEICNLQWIFTKKI